MPRNPEHANDYKDLIKASRQRSFSFCVPMEMRIHSGNW